VSPAPTAPEGVTPPARGGRRTVDPNRPARPSPRRAESGASEEGESGGSARVSARNATNPNWVPHGPPRGPYTGPVETIYTPENAPAPPKLEDLKEAPSISQYGITWTFDKPARMGQFVTGDYYIVGPVTVVDISPKPLFGKAVVDHPDWELIEKSSVREQTTRGYEGKWARNGSVLNQRNVDRGGFDSRMASGSYDPAQFTPLPIALKPGDALVSTISAPEPLYAYTGHGQPVQAAAVLTCLEKPVPADAFRPSFCDRSQRIYLARTLRRKLLYTLPRPAVAPANLDDWARAFQRPWLDVVRWGFGNPEQNMVRYGGTLVDNTSTAALLLHLDYPALDKERLLIGYVQYGVDLAGILRDGSTPDIFKGHGGFGAGRKWPLIFTGLMLDDEELRAPNARHPQFLFAEDDQTSWARQYGPEVKTWSGHDAVFESHPAWRPIPNELSHPSQWEKFGNEGYRRCCTSKYWVGTVMAARLMRAEGYWTEGSDDAFFAYMDRWMTENHVEQIKVLCESVKGFRSRVYDNIIASGNMGISLTSPFMKEMWDRYRHTLPEPLAP
jgi:hypothetical protein